MSVVDNMIHGAQVGAALGALLGLAPLGYGLFRRQKRAALIAFGVCMLAGTVGGIYAAIVAAGITIRQFLRPKPANPDVKS
jgi:hypothetical protein